VKALRSLLIASLVAVALAAPQARAADESPWRFEFHGFVSGSVYAQDNLLGARPGDGGQFLFANAARPAQDKLILGGDVRQTRLNFSMSGPKVFGGATPKAVAEFDLYGGPGAGQYGMENTLARLRIAYVELKWGGTTVIAGQFHHLVIGILPVTVGHIANPVVTTAGLIGWRTPGVTALHSLDLDKVKIEVAGQLAQTSWGDSGCNLVGPGTVTGGAGASAATDPATCPLNSSGANAGTAARGNGESAGKAGLPMVEIRAKAEGKAGDLSWMGFVAGHYDQKDMTGWASSATLDSPALTAAKATAKLEGVAAEVGGRFQFAPMLLSFNAYAGKNIANLAGSMYNQFQNPDAVNGVVGGVKERGGWAQLGGFVTKELSLYATYGIGQNDRNDIRKHTAGLTRLETNIYAGLVKYTEGAATVGLEGSTTTTVHNVGTAANPYSVKRYGSQLMATLLYMF
jgi:hypothetical protein